MFEFAFPWAFLLLPLPWLVRRFAPPADPNASNALKVPFFHPISQLLITEKADFDFSVRNQLMALIAWICLVTASAGPEWLGQPSFMPLDGRNLILAIDISGSMQATDLSPEHQQLTRLAAVKAIAGRFLERRVGDRVGLILFGTRAYLQTPLSFDLDTVVNMLEDASIGLAGPQTAIGDAIGLSVNHLRDIPEGSKALILLTDGVSNAGAITPEQAAQLAVNEGIKIYTIGIGADRAVVRTAFGPQVIDPSANLDESALTHIAEITGGLYFRAKDTQALEQVYKRLDELEPIAKDADSFRPIKELYPWPLALALLISIFLGSLVEGVNPQSAVAWVKLLCRRSLG